jgi:hypothetical protein
MKQLSTYLVQSLTIAMFFLTSGLSAQSSDAVIKITSDPITRDYKILFSSPENELPVTITLMNRNGSTAIFTDKMGVVKGFVKKYSLLDAPLGFYRWEVNYGTKTYAEEFEIVSEKRLIKESISAELDDLLNLSIKIEQYNKLPVSIFLYNGTGEQLEFIFWEPTFEERTKVINLSQFDAYEIKLEILQQGDLAFEAEYQIY